MIRRDVSKFPARASGQCLVDGGSRPLTAVVPEASDEAFWYYWCRAIPSLPSQFDDATKAAYQRAVAAEPVRGLEGVFENLEAPPAPPAGFVNVAARWPLDLGAEGVWVFLRPHHMTHFIAERVPDIPIEALHARVLEIYTTWMSLYIAHLLGVTPPAGGGAVPPWFVMWVACAAEHCNAQTAVGPDPARTEFPDGAAPWAGDIGDLARRATAAFFAAPPDRAFTLRFPDFALPWVWGGTPGHVPWGWPALTPIVADPTAHPIIEHAARAFVHWFLPIGHRGAEEPLAPTMMELLRECIGAADVRAPRGISGTQRIGLLLWARFLRTAIGGQSEFTKWQRDWHGLVFPRFEGDKALAPAPGFPAFVKGYSVMRDAWLPSADEIRSDAAMFLRLAAHFFYVDEDPFEGWFVPNYVMLMAMNKHAAPRDLVAYARDVLDHAAALEVDRCTALELNRVPGAVDRHIMLRLRTLQGVARHIYGIPELRFERREGGVITMEHRHRPPGPAQHRLELACVPASARPTPEAELARRFYAIQHKGANLAALVCPGSQRAFELFVADATPAERFAMLPHLFPEWLDADRCEPMSAFLALRPGLVDWAPREGSLTYCAPRPDVQCFIELGALAVPPEVRPALPRALVALANHAHVTHAIAQRARDEDRYLLHYAPEHTNTVWQGQVGVPGLAEERAAWDARVKPAYERGEWPPIELDVPRVAEHIGTLVQTFLAPLPLPETQHLEDPRPVVDGAAAARVARGAPWQLFGVDDAPDAATRAAERDALAGAPFAALLAIPDAAVAAEAEAPVPPHPRGAEEEADRAKRARHKHPAAAFAVAGGRPVYSVLTRPPARESAVWAELVGHIWGTAVVPQTAPAVGSKRPEPVPSEAPQAPRVEAPPVATAETPARAPPVVAPLPELLVAAVEPAGARVLTYSLQPVAPRTPAPRSPNVVALTPPQRDVRTLSTLEQLGADPSLAFAAMFDYFGAPHIADAAFERFLRANKFVGAGAPQYEMLLVVDREQLDLGPEPKDRRLFITRLRYVAPAGRPGANAFLQSVALGQELAGDAPVDLFADKVSAALHEVMEAPRLNGPRDWRYIDGVRPWSGLPCMAAVSVDTAFRWVRGALASRPFLLVVLDRFVTPAFLPLINGMLNAREAQGGDGARPEWRLHMFSKPMTGEQFAFPELLWQQAAEYAQNRPPTFSTYAPGGDAVALRIVPQRPADADTLSLGFFRDWIVDAQRNYAADPLGLIVHRAMPALREADVALPVREMDALVAGCMPPFSKVNFRPLLAWLADQADFPADVAAACRGFIQPLVAPYADVDVFAARVPLCILLFIAAQSASGDEFVRRQLYAQCVSRLLGAYVDWRRRGPDLFRLFAPAAPPQSLLIAGRSEAVMDYDLKIYFASLWAFNAAVWFDDANGRVGAVLGTNVPYGTPPPGPAPRWLTVAVVAPDRRVITNHPALP